MNFKKSKNAKEAIEFFRNFFNGDVVIDGVHISDELIQELFQDKLDMIEKEYKYLKTSNKEILSSIECLQDLFDMYIDEETATLYYDGGDFSLDSKTFKKIERLF